MVDPVTNPVTDRVLGEDPGSGKMAEEPAITVGTIQTAIAAVIALVVAIGIPVDDSIKIAILGVVAAAWPLWTAFRIRGNVFSPATVREVAVKVENKTRATA